MQRSRIKALMVVMVAVGIIGGCPTTPDPGGGGGGTTALTDTQKAAVNAVFQQFEALAASFASFVPLVDDRLDIATLSGLNGLGTTCPAISYVAVNDTPLINFNFGYPPPASCSADGTAGLTFTGGTDIRPNKTSGATTIEYLNLTIAGKAVTGKLALTLARDASGITLTGQIDEAITTDGTGSVTGSLTIQIATDGQITVTTGALTLNDGTTSYDVTLSNVVIDPVGNASFVPESGTVTLDMGGTAVAITFGAQSPTDGGVEVSVAGGTAVAHQVSN
ncbi:MAG: hypothetical protein KKB50_14035 [Planctomycetes bacterium]|nr:hypothetical protein [Planctomycetota bacterium]